MKQIRSQIPNILHLKEVSSTNDYLSQLCAQGGIDEFLTVIAEKQTAGKGQRGNSWESANKQNLLFSFLIRPSFIEAREQFYLSMMTAISIAEALDQYISDISIKWPNDIYWKDYKIAGILIENELEGKSISQCIIGIGLNVNQQKFTSPAPNPVSLWQITNKETDQSALLETILNRIIYYYNELRTFPDITKATLLHTFLEKLYRRKGYHLYSDKNGSFKARFHHLQPDGRLFLEDEQGNVRPYFFKEVNYILP